MGRLDGLEADADALEDSLPRRPVHDDESTRCCSPSPSPNTCTPTKSPSYSAVTAPSTPPGFRPTKTTGLPPKPPAQQHAT